RDPGPPAARWGQLGGKVRGVCNKFGAEEGYGFIAYWPSLPETPVLAATDTKPAYFKTASLQDASIIARLPSRNVVLEFELSAPAKPDGAPEARRIHVVTS
ncbi:MAG: hypothetical protein ACRYHA_14330, partial [Janthinobacterium lividum]